MAKKTTKSTTSYARRRFRKRYKYNYGNGNYMSIKFEIGGCIRFPDSAGQPEIRFLRTEGQDIPANGADLGTILNLIPQYTQYANMFNERKVRGVRYEITPMNTGDIEADLMLVFGWGPFTSQTVNFNTLLGSNSGVVLNPNQKVVKYVPLHGNYEKITYNIWDHEGGIGVAANKASAYASYSKTYCVKISFYVTLRGIRV